LNLRILAFAGVGAAMLWAPHALASDLSRPPALRAGTISADDYPPLALRAEMQGVARTRITIGTDGRVSNCGIEKTSGFALLDRHSCALVTARFVFDPALDAKGHAIEVQAVQPVAWLMPESAPPTEDLAEDNASSGSRF
jgi:TonB family protein